MIALALLSAIAIYRAQVRIFNKKNIGFGITESDVIADFTAVAKISFFSFIGGMFSTFIGFTNFLFYSEMLEKTGKTSVEAHVTAVLLISLGSFSSSIEYFTRGTITLEYMI